MEAPATVNAASIPTPQYDLKKEFAMYDGEAPDQLPSLIPNFLPEGVTFFGAPAGTIKSWVGISIAKSLVLGVPLWSMFKIPQRVAVLYLIPEASDASFKRRLKKMRFPANEPRFRFRTISQGVTLSLQHPMVLAEVDELQKQFGKVLVIVDTAIRFLNAKDENAAAQNHLNRDSEILRFHGASVLFMHHSPKELNKKRPKGKGGYEQKLLDSMTSESVLRGTGDFSAMPDCVYGFLRDERLYDNGSGPEEVIVKCCKPRDLDEPPRPFRLALRRGPKESVIDITGDLEYRSLRVEQEKLEYRQERERQTEMLVNAVQQNSKVSLRTLQDKSRIRRETVIDLLAAAGWERKGEGRNPEWTKQPSFFPQAI